MFPGTLWGARQVPADEDVAIFAERSLVPELCAPAVEHCLGPRERFRRVRINDFILNSPGGCKEDEREDTEAEAAAGEGRGVGPERLSVSVIRKSRRC